MKKIHILLNFVIILFLSSCAETSTYETLNEDEKRIYDSIYVDCKAQTPQEPDEGCQTIAENYVILRRLSKSLGNYEEFSKETKSLKEGINELKKKGDTALNK